jgi:hypothetical protein
MIDSSNTDSEFWNSGIQGFRNSGRDMLLPASTRTVDFLIPQFLNSSISSCTLRILNLRLKAQPLKRSLLLSALLFALTLTLNGPIRAEDESHAPGSWYDKIEVDWGGHIKARGLVSRVDNDSIYELVDTGTYYDWNTQGRLKNRLFLGNWGYCETHYEAICSGGDTRKNGRELGKMLPFPDFLKGPLLFRRPLNDDRRLMDLTQTIDSSDDYILYHRLDRLSLTLLPEWGLARLGRQVVTWGNGLLFNPMDLFNPFPPTDIERDYKVGDDMITTQFALSRLGDVQGLYVARRDPITNNVEWDQSSLAGKLHVAVGTTEFDVMAAHHYDDIVTGIGSTGYLGDTAWRLDATWTFLDGEVNRDNYLSLVADIDYSWVWWQKNFYGFLEFYFNGLGKNDYLNGLTDPDITERLDRGELFVLGRYYLSGHINIELHPLFNFYFTVINNLKDPSGILQPRMIYDLFPNFQVTLGGNIYYGEDDTEYGGIELPGTDLQLKPANSGYLWFSYFF